MTTARLELRVLHGPQAGARLPLSDGRYLLGGGERADIVLHGPSVAAEHCAIDLDGERATVEPLGGGVFSLDGRLYERGDQIAPGVVIELGGVWLCLDRPGAAWPARVEPVRRHDAPEPAPTAAASESSDADKVLAEPPVVAAAPSSAPVKADKPAPTLATRLGQAALSGIALAAIVTMLLVWLAGGGKSAPAATAATAPEQGRARVETAIREAGLGRHLSLKSQNGAWLVEGHVADDAARAKLARVTAALPERVVVRVYADDALLDNGRATLSRIPLPLRLESLGGGVLKLSGAAPNREAVEDAVERLKEDLAGLKRVDTAVLLPDELAARLEHQLAAAGLSERVKTARQPDGGLQLTGTLGADDFIRWEKLFADFNHDYGAVLPVHASFVRLARPLPFRIRGVVGGEQPYVLTADGAKITVGGQIGAYKLIAVNERELVFDGPERVSITR